MKTVLLFALLILGSDVHAKPLLIPELNYDDFFCKEIPGTTIDGETPPTTWRVANKKENDSFRGGAFSSKEDCTNSLEFSREEKSPSICAPVTKSQYFRLFDLRDGNVMGSFKVSCPSPKRLRPNSPPAAVEKNGTAPESF